LSERSYDANQLALIIRDNSSLTANEIRSRVDELKKEYEPLLSTESACFLLAKEEGVDLPRFLGLQKEPELDVENLVEDMNDVKINLKVKNVFNVNEFDGGRVRNIKVFDDTGSTHLVVWGSDVEAFEGVQSGDVLRIDSGYTKFSDYNSQVEIHVGDGGSVVDVESGELLI